MHDGLISKDTDLVKDFVMLACQAHHREELSENRETKIIFYMLFQDKLTARAQYLADEYRSFLAEVPGEITLKEYVTDSLKEYLSIHFNEYIYEIREEKQYKAEEKARIAEIERQQQAEWGRKAEIAKQEKAERARQAEIERQQQAERLRNEQKDFIPISNAIIHNIASLVDGNNATYKDVVSTGFKAETATINMYVHWKFIWKNNDVRTPGGRSESPHFGDSLSKFNAHTEALKAKIVDTRCMSSFLDAIKAKGEAGMLSAQTSEHTIHKSNYFSYYYDCNNCSARGMVTCGGCSGSGRNHCYVCGGTGQESYLEPVTSSNGLPNGSVTRYKACSNCGGYSTVTCSSCGGSGKRRCGSCEGKGWFLVSRQVLLIGQPTYSLSVSGNLEQTALRDNILKNLNVDSIYRLTSYSVSRSTNANDTFIYNGPVKVLRQGFSIKSLSYNVYTYSNPPTIEPFLKTV